MKYRQMKRQPRAKTMLPAIKELITLRALQDRDKDRTLLSHELREEIQEKFPREIAPTVATIIKRISESRNHAPDILDQPWHLGLLDQIQEMGVLNISADGIDAILKVQRWISDTNKKTMRKSDWFGDILGGIRLEGFSLLAFVFNTVTIRQAKWISALYKFTGDEIDYLWAVSFFYSERESFSRIAGIDFDTKEIDTSLSKGKKSFIKMCQEKIEEQKHFYEARYHKSLEKITEKEEIEGDDNERHDNKEE
ncbi:hypothetical protein ACFLTT_00805 [Chloroflexota bacterium]